VKRKQSLRSSQVSQRCLSVSLAHSPINPIASSPLNKRKRDQSDAEVETHDQTDADESQSAAGDADEEEEEYTTPRMKSKADPSSKRSKKQAKKLPRKPRTLKVTAPKTLKETSRRPRKGKATDDAFDVGKIATETKIKNDNSIFSQSLLLAPASWQMSHISLSFRCHSQSVGRIAVDSRRLHGVPCSVAWLGPSRIDELYLTFMRMQRFRERRRSPRL